MLFEESSVKQIFLGDEGKNQNYLGHQEFTTVETVFQQKHNSTRSTQSFALQGLIQHITQKEVAVSFYLGLFLKGHFGKL